MKELYWKYPCLPLEEPINIEIRQVDGTLEKKYEFTLGQILQNEEIVEKIIKYVYDISVWNSENRKYRDVIVKILSTNKDAQEVEE